MISTRSSQEVYHLGTVALNQSTTVNMIKPLNVFMNASQEGWHWLPDRQDGRVRELASALLQNNCLVVLPLSTLKLLPVNSLKTVLKPDAVLWHQHSALMGFWSFVLTSAATLKKIVLGYQLLWGRGSPFCLSVSSYLHNSSRLTQISQAWSDIRTYRTICRSAMLNKWHLIMWSMWVQAQLVFSWFPVHEGSRFSSGTVQFAPAIMLVAVL